MAFVASCPLPRQLVVIIVLLFVAAVFPGAVLLNAQQDATLVGNQGSGLGVFDPNGSLLFNVPSGYYVPAVGANPRLAFASAGYYLSVVDLTIQREIRRLPTTGVSRSLAFSSDGRYVLVEEAASTIAFVPGNLDIVDTATFRTVRKVNLGKALGLGGYYSYLGSTVVIGNKAYVTSKRLNLPGARSAVAVIDLGTFRVGSIPVPSRGTSGSRGLQNAAATPDGKYLVMVQNNNLVFVNTATRKVDIDRNLSLSSLYAIAITPAGNDPSKTYGYVLHKSGFCVAVAVVNMVPNSPTFGQVIPNTDVNLSLGNFGCTAEGLAINPEGTRLVAALNQQDPNNLQPNMQVIDTDKMLHDPSHAVISVYLSGGGGYVDGVSIANVTTTPPQGAPVVTSTSGDIVNDMAHTVDIYGSNFARDAFVRIGNMPPLPATYVDSGHITVTVPAHAPAGVDLDVIVTNPNLKAGRALQHQSGLLAGSFNIYAGAAFNPNYQICLTVGNGGTFEIYDPQKRKMVDMPPGDTIDFMGIFNADGKEAYALSLGIPRVVRQDALQWDLANKSLNGVIPLDSSLLLSNGYEGLASGNYVATGKPVVYVPAEVFNNDGSEDLQINIIDSDPTSPNFNKIVQTIPAGINTLDSDIFMVAIAMSPDGKWAYLSYDAYNYNTGEDLGMLAIFDMVNGGKATQFDTTALGADLDQYELKVSPDGKTLLLQGYYGTAFQGYQIIVCDLTQNPKNPTLLANIQGHVPGLTGPLFLNFFQIGGNHLFVQEGYTNTLLTFNFDPVHMDFTQVGAYSLAKNHVDGYSMAASPDGSLLYLFSDTYDFVQALDGNALANNQPPVVTNLATARFATFITLNPVAISGPAHRSPTALRPGLAPQRPGLTPQLRPGVKPDLQSEQ